MGYARWKRVMDVCGAGALLLVSLPLWVLIVPALLLTQGPPLLFRQQRIGRDRRPFAMFKFRTMTKGHPPRLPDRPVAKVADDPRVTPLGRLLRRLALDEIPQFLNVLRGEMSLVGPRPLPLEDLAHPGWLAHVDEDERARRLAWMERRHQVLPGVTGRWQISAEAEDDFENWMACDLAYVETAGLAQDVRILLRTPWAVLRGRAPHRHINQT